MNNESYEFVYTWNIRQVVREFDFDKKTIK
jgi:hypothetical protein